MNSDCCGQPHRRGRKALIPTQRVTMCGQALGLFSGVVLAGLVGGVTASPSPISDECTTYGHICTEAGQTCVDAEQTLEGFWRCVCPSPNDKIGKYGAPATCPTAPAQAVDECTIYGHICTAAGQTCVDAEHTLEGFWRCMCPSPNDKIGKSGGPATCPTAPVEAVDECTIYGHICTAAGQTCVDAEHTLEGFWRCMCPSPNDKIGKYGAPATCPISAPPAAPSHVHAG